MNTNNLCYDSNELREIVNLTQRLCGLPENSIRKSRSAYRYWGKMVKYFQTCSKKMGYDVIYAALYCVHWGTTPRDMPSNVDFIRLVHLLKEELLKVTVDIEHIKGMPCFSKSLAKVFDSNSPHRENLKAETYLMFLDAKTKYRLYGGEIEVTINLLDTYIDDFNDMKAKAEVYHRYKKIKGYLINLIPAARIWSDDEFSNDATIVEQLNNLYGVSAEWCNANFDALIGVLEAIELENDYYDLIVHFTDLPMPLAKLIWPVDTEARMEKLFCDVCGTIRKYTTFMRAHGTMSTKQFDDAQQEIRESWLYRLIAEWYENGTRTLEPKTRSILLSVSMGVL